MRSLKGQKKLPPRFSDILDEYAVHLKLELGRGDNTVSSYLGDIMQFCEFAAKNGAGSFADIDSDIIALWLGGVCASAKSTTQSRKISALRSLSIFLVDEGIWEKNLTDVIARPKLRRNIPEVLSAEQVDALLSAPSISEPEGVRDRAMLELMYGSGLRVSELCAVKESDLDIESRIMRVKGKGGKTRLVPLGEVSLNAIGEYKKIRSFFLKKSNPAELFLTRRGAKLSRKTFWFNIVKYAKKIGIGHVKPHMLRHSFATHLLRNGANILSIKEMLGHSDLSTTQIYTNLLQEDILKQYKAGHPRSKMDIKRDL